MNNEDKILAVLERLQGDMSSLKDDVLSLKSDVFLLKESQEVIRDSQLKVEHEELPKVQAALDAYAGVLNKRMEHEKRIAALERTVDDHGVRIFKLEEAV